MASLSRAGMDRGTAVGAAARFAGQVGRDGDRAEPRRRAERNTDRRAVRTAHARRLTGVSDPGPWAAAGRLLVWQQIRQQDVPRPEARLDEKLDDGPIRPHLVDGPGDRVIEVHVRLAEGVARVPEGLV